MDKRNETNGIEMTDESYVLIVSKLKNPTVY